MSRIPARPFAATEAPPAALLDGDAGAPRHTRPAGERPRAANAGRAARHRFQALVEHSSDAIALLDAQGRRRYVSSGNARLLGLDQAELVGQLAFDRVHPDDLPRLRGVFAALLADPGGSVPWESRLRHADGTWRWVEGTVTNLLGDPDVAAVVVNFRDVTERVAAHRALATRERQFRALVEHSADGVAVVDATGKVRYASPAAARIAGHDSAGVIGPGGLDRVHRDDRAPARALFARLLAHPGESGTLVCRVRHDDGTWRWLETTATNHLDDPDVEGVVVNVRDVTEREAAAETLRASETRFHALWDIAVDAMALSDERGMVVLANPAYCELHRLSMEAVVGQPFSIIFAEEQRAQATERYEAVFRSETVPPMFEATVRRPDGTERIVESRVTFLTQDGRRVAMLSVVRDITERVRTQMAHHELAAIVESSEDAIVGTHLDGTITSWNEGAERLYGYRAGEALGRSMGLIIPPERVTEMDDLVARIARGERIARLETVRVLKNGSIVDVALTVSPIRGVGGEITGASAIARDTTDRHRVQAQMLAVNQRLRIALADLATSRTRLHDLFMQAPAIIATVRQPDHVFELVNPHYVRLFGRTDAAELVGRPIREAVPELEAQGYVEVLDRVYRSGEPFIGTEMVLRLRRGSEGALEDVYVSFVVQPSRDADGAVDGLVLFATEVTTQVRAQQQLIQQERLHALGQMASGIAHDLNNALTPVVGYSDLLLAALDTSQDLAKVRHYLALINTGAQDAAAIVGRLREFYRKREPDEVHEAIDVAAVMQQVVELTQPRWRDQAQAQSRTIRVETAFETVPAAAAQSFELREALTNLVFNAIDALPQGGTITLGCRLEDPGDSGDRAAPGGPGAAGGKRVALTVRDDGTGMPDEVRRRCLEPFFTTKGVAGSGLGLSMVFGTAQRWGGDLAISSTPGRGTTITLLLPAYQAGPPAVALSAVPAGCPLAVLVVDDAPGVLEVTAACLRVDGHTVTPAPGGRAALGALRDGHFDVVIVDRAMPDMSGGQLAVAIKALAPELPVIMLTGFGGLMRARHEQPAGVDAIAAKPITLASLRQVLASVRQIPPGTSPCHHARDRDRAIT